MSFYEVLTKELREDPLGIGYADMDAQQILDALEQPREWVPVSQHANLRAVAAILTDEEYGAARAALDQMAAQSIRVADMLDFLKQESGIDFGHPDVRAMIDAMPGVSDEVKTKLKRLGERQVSRREKLGLPCLSVGNIESALKMIAK